MFESFDEPLADKPKVKIPVILSEITATKLAELDLDTELLDQYKEAKRLLAEFKDDDQIPLSQKAQLLTVISTIINQVIKNQQELHSIEKIKKIELVLIETLKEFPDVKQMFLDKYEQNLND